MTDEAQAEGKEQEGERAPLEVTKERIEAAAREMFGECECLWGASSYKKQHSLKIFFDVKDVRTCIEIRDHHSLASIAKTLVGMHARIRARLIAQLTGNMAAAADAEKKAEQSAAIQKEKDRMAGRQTGPNGE